MNGHRFLIRDDIVKLGTVLHYKRDPYVHCEGSLNKANIDSGSNDVEGLRHHYRWLHEGNYHDNELLSPFVVTIDTILTVTIIIANMFNHPHYELYVLAFAFLIVITLEDTLAYQQYYDHPYFRL